MLGATHALYGLVVGVASQHFLPVRVELAVLLAVFGALLPDIDEPHSLVGRHFKVVGWLSRHRGLWHSFVVMIPFVIVFELLAVGYGYVFGAAFLSHLVLDGLTKAGVHPFWPSRLRFKGWLKSGGVVEWGVRGIGILLFFVAL